MGLATINIRFATDLKGFSTQMQNVERQMKKMSRQMKQVGKGMSTYITAPIVGIGVASVKTFADFEQSMAKVKAISGAVGKSFERLEKNARKLGASTRYTATDVAELQLNFSKLGLLPDEIEKVTGATLNLALATGEDLANSATVAAGTMRAFNLQAEDMGHITDVMAKSFSSSALDLEKFKTAMATVGPVAKNAGLNIEQTTGMLSVLVDRNIDASTAGTALRNIFLTLAKTGMSMNEAMSRINNSSNKNATALALFGKRGATVATVLSENIDKANELAISYENSAGSAAKMAAIMDNTLQGSMFRLKSAFQDMMIEIGQNLKPVVEKLAKFLSNLAQKFSALSPEVKKTVIAIAGIAATVGPLLVITGTVLPAMISGFSILAGPVGLIAVGVAAAAYAILKYFPQIKKAVVDVANYFIELYNQSAIVRLGIEYIKLAFNNTFTFLKTGLGVLIDYLAAFGRVMKGVFTFSWDDVKQGITDFKNNFVNRMGEMADSVEGSFKKAIENVKHNKIELVSSVSVDPEQIKEEIKQQTKKPNTPVIPVDVKQKTNNDNGDSNENVSTGTVQGVNISLLPKIRKSAAEMKIVLADSKKMLVDWSDQVNAAIQNAVAGFAVGLGEMIGHLADGTFSFAEIGGLLVKSIAGLLKSLGEAAIKIGVGMIAVKNAFLNPLGAIAAGVAMVALGSLMENAFNNSSRPMASGGIVYTPTQALVGEYANARRDPEIVAPLSKLRNILGNTGNAGVQIVESGRFVLSGADLKLVLDREMKRQNRTQ